MSLAVLPEGPCYAVIFSSTRSCGDNGYQQTAVRMEALASTMPGFLGFESARNEDGFGIAISYWDSQEAISNWKQHADHLDAQSQGRSVWYTDYAVRISKVERAYQMKS